MRCAYILLFTSILKLAQAQYFEIGIFGGASNYEGDLAPVAFVPAETHLASGAFAKFNFNKFLSVKAGYYHGIISGNDDNSPHHWNYMRNLSFISDINEVSVVGEFNVLGYQPYAGKHLLTPYIFIGAGIFHFNPKANYMGTWYALQPLGTEGQGNDEYPDRKPYLLTQFSIPGGVGFKGSINKYINIEIEFGLRKTFTDYLDDVSTTYIAKELLLEKSELSWQLSNRTDEINGGTEVLKDDTKLRGDPNNLDWYIFSGINVSYNFGMVKWGDKNQKGYYSKGTKRGLKNSKKKMECPAID